MASPDNINDNPSLADFDWAQFAEENGYGHKKVDEDVQEENNVLVMGETIEGTVVSIDNSVVEVNVGIKNNGFIPKSEFSYIPDLKVGDKVDVYVEAPADKKGNPILSHIKVRRQNSWKKIKQAYDNDETLEAYVTETTKGGLKVEVLGLKGFLPGSLIDLHKTYDFESFVDKTIEVKVEEYNKAMQNLVVSRKKVIIEEQDKIREKLERGIVLEGTVKDVKDCGVFVDIGYGVTGMVYVDNISWNRFANPQELYSEGDKIKVVVLDTDNESKISLGIKQLQPDPWESPDFNINVGDHVKGKVIKIADYGAFVEIAPDIVGLVHYSNISWSHKKTSTEDFFKKGEEVESVVLSIDKSKKKISLGIKQLTEDPWNVEKIEKEYPIGSKSHGKVYEVNKHGAFVELEEGVSGFVYKKDLSWYKVKDPSDFVKVGDEIDVIVLDVDFDKHRISLGHKQLEDNPLEHLDAIYKEGMVVEGVIKSVTPKGILLIVDGGVPAYCSSYYITIGKPVDPTTLYSAGDTCKAKVASVDIYKHSLTVSIKAVLEDEINKEYTKLILAKAKSTPVKATITSFDDDGTINVTLSEHFNGDIKPKEISWHTLMKGQDLYEVGQAIDVIIKGVNGKSNEAVCSIKRLDTQAWEQFKEAHQAGEMLTGKVSTIDEKGGLQIELPNGMFGYIASKELLQERENPQVGDTIEAKIIKNDDLNHTVRLSLHALEIDALEKYATTINQGDCKRAKIVEVSNNELIVEVDGHKGYIEKKDATHAQDKDLHEIAYVGEQKEVRFLSCTDHKLHFMLKEIVNENYPESLFNMNITEILNDLDIAENNFIFEVDKEGKADYLFESTYDGKNFDGNGKLLIDRFNGEQIHPLLEESLAPGFYSGELELRSVSERKANSNPYLFKLINIKKLEGELTNPYKYEDELAFNKQTDPSSNLSIASLLSEVGINLYTNKDRMFYELLQNADDASAEWGVDMHVQVTDGYVIITHNGYPFNKDDFESVTSAAQSTKKAKKKSTGYKGIGFKSVFSNSSKVYIKSGGFFFMFDKNYEEFQDFDTFYKRRNPYEKDWDDFIRRNQKAKNRFSAQSIPWQLLPIWIDNIPDDLRGTSFDNNKINVAIAIKMDSNTAAYKEAIEKIISNPKFMLFLRNTHSIELGDDKIIKKDKEGNHIFVKNSFIKDIPVESYVVIDDNSVLINDDYFNKCGFKIRKKESVKNRGISPDEKVFALWQENEDGTETELSDSIPDRIPSSSNTTISIVVPTDENGKYKPILNKEENRLYAYLPLRDRRFKFHFYLNADFILVSNREGVQGDNLWNQFLFYNIGKNLVSWIKQLASKEQPQYLNLLQDELLPTEGEDLEDIQALSENFNRGYIGALLSEKFILGHDEKLHSQDEVVYDESGLSKIIGPELFCQIVGTDKFLTYQTIDDSILSKSELFTEVEHFSVTKVLNFILSDDKELVIKERNSYKGFDASKRNKVENWLKELLGNKKYAEKAKKIISFLPMFTFNNRLMSIREYMAYPKILLLTDELAPIANIIQGVGISVSNENLSNMPLAETVEETMSVLEKDKNVNEFNRLANATSKEDNKLLAEEKVRLYNFFSNKETRPFVVKPSQIRNWKLFCNIKGQPTAINHLSKITEEVDPEHLLADYTIDDAEYSVLDDSIEIVAEDELFKLIVTEWDNIIASLSTEEQALSLYRLTAKAFAVYTSANTFKASKYAELKTIFYDGKFESWKNIWLFKDLKDDSQLRRILGSMTDKGIADDIVVTEYSKTPFFRRFDDILDAVCQNYYPKLSKEEVELIIEACNNDESDDIFSKFYIVENSDGMYQLAKRKKTDHIYYTHNACMRELASRIEGYRSLPESFSKYSNSEYIETGDTLTCVLFKKSIYTLVREVDDVNKDASYVGLQYFSKNENIDIDSLRKNFSISSKEQNIESKLIDIHLRSDIKLDGHTFAISELLPNQTGGDKVASEIKSKLENMDFPKGFLDKFFGVISSGDEAAKSVFEVLNQSEVCLENSTQLAFVLIYAKENNIQIKSTILTKEDNNTKYTLSQGTFVLEDYNFLKRNFVLADIYNNISKSTTLPYYYEYEITRNVRRGYSTRLETTKYQLKVLDKPRTYNGEFVPDCFDLETEEQVYSFLDYLFKLKETIETGSKESIASALELDSDKMTLSKYKLDDEELPQYVLSWINEDKTGKYKSFIRDFFNIDDDNSPSGIIRGFLERDIADINEDIIVESEVLRDKTCRWIKEKGIELNDNQYNKLFNLLNPELLDKINYESLRESKSDTSKFMEFGDFTIYLVDGKMPHNVFIDDNLIYSYEQGEATVDEKDIYLNEGSKYNLNDVLIHLVDDPSLDFTSDDFLDFVKNRERPKEEQGTDSKEAFLNAGNDYGISIDEQKEYQEKAREILLPILETELGLDISNATDEGYSVIDGITKNGQEIPVVIKSYKYHNRPLRINPAEWERLLRPNSLLAVLYGNNEYGWYKLKDLLKSKDEIVLSFSSENLDKEDRIDKFAELLKYFNNVHFNFKELAEPRPFNTDDPLDCLFNDKSNDASKADLSGGSLSDIE